MGRPSKLSEAQWAEVARRLIAGEKPAALAREFKVSPSTISERFSERIGKVKTVASQIVTAERGLRELPVADQLLAVSLADDLRAISTHMAGAAKFSAATAHRLAGIANAKVQEVDDAAPLTDVSREALKDVGILSRLANEASSIPLNLIAANKDTVKRLNETPDPGAPDLTRLPKEDLEALERIIGKAAPTP